MNPNEQTVEMSHPSQGDMNDQEWRIHGEARRKAVIEQDITDGGTSFFINPKCPVERYFDISDRVLQHFRRAFSVTQNMNEVYVMGYRLEVFLSIALPQHPDYNSLEPKVTIRRVKSKNRLKWIRERVELIALRIDEEELNKFILKDLESEDLKSSTKESETSFSDSSDSIDALLDDISVDHGDDDDDDDDDDDNDSLQNDGGNDWEDFTGWSVDATKPSLWNKAPDVFYDGSETSTTEFSDTDGSSPERLSTDDECPDDEYSYIWSGARARQNVASEIDSSFLMAIATQSVRYESDSEAVDSWAQDGSSSIQSSSCGPDSSQGKAVVDALKIVDKARPLSPTAEECLGKNDRTKVEDSQESTSQVDTTERAMEKLQLDEPDEDDEDDTNRVNSPILDNCIITVEEPKAENEKETVEDSKESTFTIETIERARERLESIEDDDDTIWERAPQFDNCVIPDGENLGPMIRSYQESTLFEQDWVSF